MIQHTIATAVLNWILARRNPGGDPGSGTIVMRYPAAMRVVTWVLSVVSVAGLGALFLFVPMREGDGPYFAFLVLLMGGLCGTLWVEVSGVAHEVSESGLQAKTPWRGRRFLPWEEVTQLRFDSSMQVWRVKSSTGQGVWVSQYLSGLGAFAQQALSHVRPEVIDAVPQTRALLFKLDLELSLGESTLG